MKEKIIDVNLLGQTLTLKTDLPEEMVKEVLIYLKEKEKEIGKGKNFLPPMKIALLMLLQISSDYVKIKKELDFFRKELREEIKKVDKYLKEEGSLGCT